jgi:hypothetical protein
MNMPTKRHITQLACAALLFCALAPSHAANPAPTDRVIRSTEQGAHEVSALGGKLVLIAATLADTQSYKRTLSFYFSDKGGTDLLHVPVIESKVDHTLTLQSISRGEETIADAALAVRGKKVYLIQVARNRSDRGAVARWFQFSEAGDDYPDGPAYVFKPVAQHELKQPASIEAALQTELKRKL